MRKNEKNQTMNQNLLTQIKIFSFIFLASIPTEFPDCFGPYSPDAAAAAAMHYQFGGSYPTGPHGKFQNIFTKLEK